MPALEGFRQFIASPSLSVMPATGLEPICLQKLQCIRYFLEVQLERAWFSILPISLPEGNSILSSPLPKPTMRLLSVFAALVPALTGLVDPIRARPLTSGSSAGSPSQPYIFIDNGYDYALGFLSTVQLSTGDNVPVLNPDYKAATNSYLASSVFMIQPTNTTSWMPIQLLTTQGPTGAAPKGLNYVAVKGTQSQGSTGFYVSPNNDNVFSTNTKFRSFVHCPSVTAPNTTFPQLFWAAAGTTTPSGCFDSQFAVRVR